jgi:hypothetical protein
LLSAIKRKALEKKASLREATAAEFSAMALHHYQQKCKRQRAIALAAKKRNDEFVRSMYEAQKKINDTCLQKTHGLLSSQTLLEKEKKNYSTKIEQILPAWQEKLQEIQLKKLQELEFKKREIEKRRFLAKKTFEKEQSINELIRQTV